MKTRFNLSLFNTMMLIGLIIGFSACKNKKKISEISDPQAVKEQLAEELGDEEDEADTEDISTNDRVAVKEPSKSQKLENYFAAVASAASSASADASMREALGMFSNADAPVLIVIYRKDGTTDYDEPTTIKRYFEYLKDTKNNKAVVEEMVLDDYGNIKELVLKK